MRETVPVPLSRRDERLLAAVAWLVPAPYGESIAGDLAETWTEGASATHARDAFDAVRRCWGALASRVCTRHRAPLAAGAALGLTAHLVAWAAWRTVLAHVPLRADHPPHLAWVVVTSGIAAAAAAFGWHLVCSVRASTPAQPPESFS